MKVRQTLQHFGYRMRTISGRNLQEIRGASSLEDILADMSLDDLNRVIYRCDAEEKDDGKGFGTYDIPKHGRLPYCGLQGRLLCTFDHTGLSIQARSASGTDLVTV